MAATRSFLGLPADVWRREPFRLFFPLGVLLAWIGIGHWAVYAVGLTHTYSCSLHGFVQMQGFMVAFALGFLLTALPRRTQTSPPSALELIALAVALIITTVGALVEAWLIAESAYAALLVVVLQFALRRLLGRAAGRRPPAAFVLIPIAVLHGLGGAALIGVSNIDSAPAWTMGFGRLLVEQGVFLCLTTGVGNLVLPLVAGAPPPADFGAAPRERWRALAYTFVGIAIFTSLLLEQLGWLRAGPLLRAAVVIVGLGGGAWRGLRKAGLHRRLVKLSVWLIPIGLVAAGLFPDYRVPALHILFIGGFALMAFAVATHVALGHLGLDPLGRPIAVMIAAVMFLLALAARVAADASHTYFDHLAWAAGCWLIGSLAWLIYFGPKLLRRPP
ncbi:MAG TPA: NnrS family protein [Candidatus Kryptonia bacterium]|nr:NnrS family protein [Candidatus Kryptonia bacterium]